MNSQIHPSAQTDDKAGLFSAHPIESRHVQQFEDKWFRGGAAPGELLIGNADISSWTDLNSAYAAIRHMRLVPFSMTVVLRLALVTVAPLLPLTLRLIPAEGLISELLRALC
jgi:hypothetical protein